jgi:hypothetical protein
MHITKLESRFHDACASYVFIDTRNVLIFNNLNI